MVLTFNSSLLWEGKYFAVQGGDRVLYHGNLTEALLVRAMRPNRLVMLAGGRRLDNRGDPEEYGFSDVEDSGSGNFDDYLVEDALDVSVSNLLL